MKAELIKWISEQDFRFRQGMAALTFVNFALLVLTASDKIQALIQLPAIALVAILVPCGFLGVWLFGYLLDVWAKYPHQQAKVSQERTPWVGEIIARLERIEERQKAEKVI